MKKALNFMLRHSIWVAIGGSALIFLQPEFAEIKTLLLITAIEALALALSGVSVFVYTRIDFTKYFVNANPGLVFLGVHMCVGLIVLGVYIAQFGA